MHMTKKQRITNFITNFKQRSGEKNQDIIESFFMEGSCYWFAKILQDRFPNGKILYDVIGNHFLYYGGNTINIEENGIFDITGEVTQIYVPWILQGSVVEWETYPDDIHKERIWRDCIAFGKEEK